MLIVLTIADSFGMGLYAGLLTFGNILLPTLGAVIIYSFIKRWTTFTRILPTLVFQITILVILFIFGLFAWAAIDAYLFETLTLENIKDDYKSQFSGFLPVVFSEAVLIPIFDLWLTKRK